MDALTTFLADPVVTRTVGAALSIVFLAGAWQKLRDLEVFAAAVENYRLLPPALVPLVARALPVLELAAGLLLLFPAVSAAGGMLSGCLLAVVTAAVAINLLRGHSRIDCGCGGLSSQPLSWALVVRNLVLLAAVALAAQHESARVLVWADYFTVSGAVLALVGLYVSVNQLMTNAPLALAIRK